MQPTDPDYPSPLYHLAPRFGGEAPPLFIRGRLPHLPGVAVVGTRRASAPAMRCAAELSTHVASAGYSLWSGGAIGIDTAVHEAALEASAPTVVVMAGGLDDPYPKQNAPLFDRVLSAGGALISVQADGTARRQWQFLLRNAVLAALSDAMVVVQAPAKSGALSAARHARAWHKPVFVVPHSPWDPLGSGSALELTRGGIAVTGGRSLRLALAGRSPTTELDRSSQRPSLHRTDPLPRDWSPQRLDSAEQRTVWSALGSEACHLDVIMARCSLPPAALAAAILALTLEGIVVEEPTGHFRRASPP